MLDLYEHYINSQITCDNFAVAVGIADLVNGNQDESIAYADRFISQLSHPLDCVRTIIEMSSNIINSTYTQAAIAVKNAQIISSNSSSVCKSFLDQVAIIKAGVFDIFNRIENYTSCN